MLILYSNGKYMDTNGKKDGEEIEFNKPYSLIAYYYDDILRYINYDEWYRYIRELMFRYLMEPGKILEIGTGTGRFGAKFSKDDFEIYGMDICPEMLDVARKRAFNNFRLFCADARSFYLSGRFDFVFSVHDTLNYIINFDDMKKVFLNVKNILSDKGIFMFDLTTLYNIQKNFHRTKTKHVIGNDTIYWSNEFDVKTNLVNSTLTVKKIDNTRITEKHVQRIYKTTEIEKALSDCGFEIIDIFGDYTFKEITDETIMVNFVTRVK